MTKGLLLIDDSTEHQGVLVNIADYLKANERVNVIARYINPLGKPYWDDNKDPNPDNVVAGAKSELSTLSVGLIIVDQYYSDATFDGLTLISKLRQVAKFKNCPIFLISGKRDKIVRDIFSAEGMADTDKVNELAKIMSYGINRFLDKSFRDEAIEILKQKNLNDVLPTKLREYENQAVTIKRFTPRYAEITLEQLADHIDSNSADAPAILDEMFELTLAHYINVNASLR